MSTQVSKQTKPNSQSAKVRLSQVDQFVGKQLHQTMRQVRAADAISAFVALLAYVLAFFIVVALIDGWIYPLSTLGRICALAVLILGLGFIGWKMIGPLVVRKINPQYAAKMIEDAKPTFKNSLLNYLSLRKKESKTKRAVLQEVTRKAAVDLKSVSLENTVDRSNVIRMGFILVALAAIAIVYSVLSPKNPLQTVSRVMAPTAKIAKPAVVRILDVDPGDTEVFFGETLEVSAEIRGRHEPDEVRLYYSSIDGTFSDVLVPMNRGDSKTHYIAKISPGKSGIQSPLTYWIEARDGRSPDFEVHVRTKPAITITELKIQPPAYTKLPERTILGHGEVQCPEGSRITVQAKANLPIKVAHIELLQAVSDAPDNEEYRSEDIAMEISDHQATGNFFAVLNSSRTKPKFTHYRVRFVSENGHRNENPNIYPIRVIADLGPEVEIVRPAEKEITLPLNQPLRIEVRAADLDFEISSVDLEIDHEGSSILDENLHLKIKPDTGGNQLVSENQRVTASMLFKPSDHRLNSGDRVILHASAADNRHSVSGQSAPNISYTENYTLIITDPIDNPRNPDQPNQKSADDGNSNQQNRDSDQENKSGKNGNNDTSEQQRNRNDQQSSENDNGESGDSSGGGESSDDQGEQSRDSGSNSGDSSSDSQSDGNEGGEGDADTGDAGKTGEPNANNGSESQENSNDNSQGASSDNDASSASGNAESSADNASEKSGGAQGNGTSDDSSAMDQSAGNSETSQGQNTDGSSGNRQSGEGGSNRDDQANGSGVRDNSLSDGQQEPLTRDATDREKFERLKDWLDKKNQGQDGQESDEPSNAGSDSEADPDSETNPDKGSDDTGNNGNSADNDNDTSDSGSRDRAPSEASNNDNRDNSQNTEGGDNQPGEDNSKDGNPQNGAKNGGQSDNGSPDQNSGNKTSEAGTGEKSQQPDQGTTESGDQGDKSSQQTGENKKSEGNQTNEGSSGDGSSKEPDKNGDSSQGSQGKNSENPGDQGKSGQDKNSGDQKGQDQPSGSSGNPADQNQVSSSGDQSSNSENSGESSGGENSGSKAGQASASKGGSAGTGGGGGSGADTSNGASNNSTPQGDKANLEYAKKATDLVLNQLDDEKFSPSEEMLEDLNMSPEELREFARRWQEMKDNARSGNVKAKRQYEQALQSLGLRPKTRGRRVNAKKDKLYGLSEDGAIDQIPAGVNVDEFHEYLKSLNRVKQRPRR